ncbi:gastrula zinc finger protein XlCGF57.1-like [Notolabrus celidotus]|uniref:gastrula zinc finger protein XlCGF57.1-like n=1 Tax=Notolabrus celidotus TaxID=1203425 RepID=UPI00148FA960|nr:gastrula zinc finger protein XlCGF57.1-like [Notolabrus celidotus]
MSGLQDLKDLFKQQLLAGPTSGYEEDLHRQRKLLVVILTPGSTRRGAVFPADVQQLSGIKEEPPEQQEWSLEDAKLPHIKEGRGGTHGAVRRGEQLQGLEEEDVTKFTFTTVSVKSEDEEEEEEEEEEPQSSLVHQGQTEQMETDADGEDCEEAEPERHLQPETEVKTEDSYEPETKVCQPEIINTLEDTEQMRLKMMKKSHSCSQCGKTFKRNWHLTEHMMIHTGEKPFSCSICGKRFTRKYPLTQHVMIHTKEKPYRCSECGKRFNTKRSMKRHRLVHGGGKGFSCLEGARKSRHGRNKSSHMETEQEEKSDYDAESIQTLTGEIQTQPGEQSASLFDHSTASTKATSSDAQSQTEEKPFGCSECGTRFTQKRSLTRHMATHTGEKPFSCSMCGRRFARKGNMTTHMIIHTGETPFSCSKCGKKFNSRGSMNNHRLVQCGEKAISSSECDVGSDGSSNMQTHTGENPVSFSEYSSATNVIRSNAKSHRRETLQLLRVRRRIHPKRNSEQDT